MRKLVLLIALITGFSVQSNAQVNLYDSLKNDLKTVVTTLEGPTKQVYLLHKKEVIIGAWSEIITPSLILLIFIILSKVLIRKAKDDSDWDGPAVFTVCITVVLLLVAIICTLDGITTLMNVDYHAMKDLVKNIRG